MKKISRQISITFFILELLALRSTAFCPRFKYGGKCSISKSALSPTEMRNEKGQSVASIYSEASSSESTLESESEFDWDAIAKDVFRKDNRPVILFDGVCALCNGGVNFALDNDSKGTFLSPSHMNTALPAKDTWIHSYSHIFHF